MTGDEEPPFRYPDESKTLAPSLLAQVLRVPAALVDPTLPPDTHLADFDGPLCTKLTGDARRRLAQAIEDVVRQHTDAIAHLRPFVDMPDDGDPARLPVGAKTRATLETIPDGWAGALDVGSLFGLRGFTVRALLDLTSAIDFARDNGWPRRSPVPEQSDRDGARGLRAAFRTPARVVVGDPRGALPLDWLVPDAPPTGTGSWVADHWDELVAEDLPAVAVRAALGGADALDVLSLMAGPQAVAEGWEEVAAALPARLAVDERSAQITLARQRLLGDEVQVPTLESIGLQLGLTRERVRQLEQPRDALLRCIRPRDRLAISVSAWFALNPHQPFSQTAIRHMARSPLGTRHIELVLEALGYPHADAGGVRFWVTRLTQMRALAALVEEVTLNFAGRGSEQELAAQIRTALPGIDRALDLAPTLGIVCSELQIAVGIEGDAFLARGGTGTLALARKMATFLRARAFPAGADELSGAIELARWPFEATGITGIEPEFLLQLADLHPDLLARTGSQLRATGLLQPDPRTNLSVLYGIVRDNGGPISTSRLLELAQAQGVSPNVTMVLIHGSRAPCLLPLARGVVGLVGRDDVGVVEGPGSVRALGSPADVPTCVLLPEGWAVRVPIDEPVLADGAWEVPEALANHLGLRLGRVLRLTASERRHRAALRLEPKVHSCPGTGLERLLHEVDASQGDLAFVVLRPPHYRLVVRRVSELSGASGSDLARVCWSCGLDPNTASAPDVWRRLGRALGGGSDRASVRARLLARGETEIAAALDADELRVSERPDWPEHWRYTASLASDPAAYALQGKGDAIRIAIGIAMPGYRRAAGEFLTDGGLVWVEGAAGLGEESYERVNVTGAPSEWVRWARSEHSARRSALAGHEWLIEVANRGTFVCNGHSYADIVDALASVGSEVEGVANGPVERSRRPYPRGALSFSQAVRSALRNGLRSLSADPDLGFRAEYGDGVVDSGPTLLDVLDRRV